jgi:tetrahydromethanopterin S-methyltransferase subunit G
MPPETLDLHCQLAMLRQHVDDGFKFLNERIDKLEADLEKSEVRVMAALAQLERRVEKLEARIFWLISMQITTLLGVLGLFAKLM